MGASRLIRRLASVASTICNSTGGAERWVVGQFESRSGLADRLRWNPALAIALLARVQGIGTRFLAESVPKTVGAVVSTGGFFLGHGHGYVLPD